MTKTPMNELAHHSAGLLFYWLFCPRCVFDIHIKSLGYSAINFGQEVSCRCPNCEKIIVKKVGIDLGVINERDLKDSHSLEDVPDTSRNQIGQNDSDNPPDVS